jgi:hypothetical protein
VILQLEQNDQFEDERHSQQDEQPQRRDEPLSGPGHVCQVIVAQGLAPII